MLIEERHARRYDCPFLRCDCKGQECILWRWFDKPEPDPIFIDHEDPLAKFAPDKRPDCVPKDYKFYAADAECDAFWSESDKAAIARRRGYCGGGGAPKYEE